MSDRTRDLAQFMRAAKRLWSRMERDRQLSGLNGHGHNGHPVKYAMGEKDDPREPKKPKAETPKKIAAPAAKEPPISHPMKTPLMADLADAPAPKPKAAHPHVEAAHAISTKLGENAVPHLETIIANPETKPGVKRAAAKVLETLGKKAETPSPFPPDVKKMSGGQSPEFPRKPRVPQAARIDEGGRRIQDPNAEAKSSAHLARKNHTLMVPMDEAYAVAMRDMMKERAARSHPEDIEAWDEEISAVQDAFKSGNEKLFVKALADAIPNESFLRLVHQVDKTPAITTPQQPTQASPNVAREYDPERAADRRVQPTPDNEPPKPQVTPNVGGEIAAYTEKADKTQTPEFKAWFGESKVRDAEGKPLVVYHGARRSDRIAESNKFDPKRATSGPMAFFTTDADIGSNYATGKKDTSIEVPDSYAPWFKIKLPGYRKPVDIDRAWWGLSPEQRQHLAAIAPRIASNDDGDPVLLDEGHKSGIGNYDYEIREQRGNVLKTLVEGWLSSGQLFNREEQFLDVLKMAGLEGVEFHDPHAEHPGVFPVHLAIQNPLDTSAIPPEVIGALEQAGKRKRGKVGSGSDPWDKRHLSGQEWIRRLREDTVNQSTHAWTSIPDWATNALKEMGYDGIKDTGGKTGGREHAVWIPFHPTQIKSAIANKGTFDPNNPRIDLNTEKAKTQLAAPAPAAPQAQPRSPAEAQLTQAIGGRAKQAVLASGLPPQYHAPFTENLVRVLDQMPEAALQAVQSGVGQFSFHASPQALAQSLMQLGGPVADRVEAIQQRGEIIGGVVHTQADGKQTVYLDGGREMHGSAPGEASLKRHGSEYYAHELGHILGATKDAAGERHDASEAWEDIYSWEIGHTHALSKYATVSPKEAFAEFSRVLFSGLYDRAKLKGQFPRAFGYFVENGWVGDVEAERGGVKSADVFSHKVVLNRQGDHADIAKIQEAIDPNVEKGQNRPAVVSTVPLMTGKEQLPAFDKGRVTVNDIATYLSKRAQQQAGRKLNTESEQDLNQLASSLVHEAEYALSQDKSAIGWYDAKVKEAMGHIHEFHPELRKDPHRDSLYKAFIAITSNGQDVHKNFGRADELYEIWKKTGRIETTGSFGGPNQKTINKTLETLQGLVDRIGLKATTKFLKSDFTNKDLAKLGYTIGDELVTTPLKGATIFGPKIGSFYGNLNGDFSSVTMDRWFMRTFNRMRGTLTDSSPKAIMTAAQRALGVIEQIDPRDKIGLSGMSKRQLVSEFRAMAKTGEPDQSPSAVKWGQQQYRNYANGDFKEKTPANMVGKTLTENIFGVNESPSNGRERQWIRRVVGVAQQQLAAKGINISNADFQALLWYYEKNLWGKMGYNARASAPADFGEAAKALKERRNAGAANQRGNAGRGIG